MNQTIPSNFRTENNPGDLLASELNSLVTRLLPHRLLLISADPVSLPGVSTIEGVMVTSIGTTGPVGACSVQSSTDSLPFEASTFNMIIVHGLFSSGDSTELNEAQRVLTGGGQLIVIGRGRYVSDSGGQTQKLPALDVRSVCRCLKQRDFRIRQCEGFGFRGRPVRWKKRWQMAALPMADLILIRGQHKQHTHVVTPLRFSEPQTTGVRSAALDGLNREAV